MRMVIPIEKTTKTILLLERNWFVGSFTYKINNGPSQTLRSALDPNTHFDYTNPRHYHIEINDEEKTKVLIKHSWHLLFGSFRPHYYEVYVDGNLVRTFKGF